MEAMKRSYRHQDVDAMASAMEKYQRVFDQTDVQTDAIQVPEVSNADTTRYMEEALEGLTVSGSLERQKNSILMGQLNGMHGPVPKSDLDDYNRNINAASMKCFHSLTRIYWNYGYQISDVDERTFRLKRGARPTPTATFNRE
jgi:hypothetical protein